MFVAPASAAPATAHQVHEAGVQEDLKHAADALTAAPSSPIQERPPADEV